MRWACFRDGDTVRTVRCAVLGSIFGLSISIVTDGLRIGLDFKMGGIWYRRTLSSEGGRVYESLGASGHLSTVRNNRLNSSCL